jgi:nitroreductase
METLECMKKRHSVRAFKSKEVEKEKLEKILKAANSAPSAGNLQAYEIFLVRDSKKKDALASASYGQHFIAEAPVVLVFCANPSRSQKYGRRGKELYCIQDATIAAAYVQLAVTDLGLGSVWVGAFDDKQVLNVLDISESLQPVAIIPIGYPAKEPYKTTRRKLNELVKEV